MPVAGSLITTTTQSDPFSPDVLHPAYVFSDGYEIVLFRDGSMSYYAIRTSGSGGGWQARVSLGTDYLTNVHAIGIDASNNVAILYYDSGSSTLKGVLLPWNSTTHSMGTITTTGSLATWSSVSALSLWWSTGRGYWVLGVRGFLASFWASGLYLLNSSLAVGNNFEVSDGSGLTTANRMQLSGPSGSTTAYMVIGYSTAMQVLLWSLPAAYTSLPSQVGTTETAPPATLTDFDIWFDGSNLLNVVYRNSGVISTFKRTGTNTYGSTTTLVAASAASGPAVTNDSTSGSVRVFYGYTGNQANGEVAYVALFGGTGSWIASPGTVVVGGDSTGYASVTSAYAIDSANTCVDLFYVSGTGGTKNIYHYQFPIGATPNTPSNITPLGNTALSATNPNPTFSWTYSNPQGAGGDPQYAYEILVIRTSDSTTMWDSGQVVSSASSGIAYAGTTLAYGTQYSVQVKVWDTANRSPSPYSNAQNFTPVHAPDGSIFAITPSGGSLTRGTASSTLASSTLAGATSLTVQTGKGSSFTNGARIAVGVAPNIDLVTIGTRSGDTLPVSAMTHAHSSTDPVVEVDSTVSALNTNTWDILVEVQQADGHNINAYQVTTLDSTGTVIIDQGSVTSITATAPGSTFTISAFQSASMVTGTTYKLKITLTDATTGGTADTSLWALSTSFSAPGAPTGITATPNSTTGSVALSWTNGASTATVNVLARRTGTTAWTTLMSGSLITSFTAYPPLNVQCDFAIQCVSSLGIGSAVTLASTSPTLGLRYGVYGVDVRDVANPGTTYAQVGVTSQGNWQQVGQFDYIEEGLTIVPSGRTTPIDSFARTNYAQTPQQGRVYWVPASDTDGSTTITSATVISMLQALRAVNRVTCLYRDVRGYMRYMTLRDFHEEPADGIHAVVMFTLRDSGYTATTGSGTPVLF